MRTPVSYICFFTVLLICIEYIQCTGLTIKTIAPPVNHTTSANDTSDADTETDSRTGLSFQQASAYGNRNGLASGAQHTSVAAAGSIRDSQGNLNPLYHKGQAEGTGYSSQGGSPLTWANTNAQVNPGYYASGSGSAGVQGGQGGASHDNFIDTVEMPLGDGSTLLSNLKVKTHASSTKMPPTKSPPKAH